MVNITITTVGQNSVVVDFGDYVSLDSIDAKKTSYDNRDIVELDLAKDESYVFIMMRDSHGTRGWQVTRDPNSEAQGVFIVDSVNSQTSESNSDLFDKLTALRG